MGRDVQEGRVGLVQGWQGAPTAQQVRGTVAPSLGRSKDAMGLQGVRRRHARLEETKRQGRRGREVEKLME